LIKDNYQSVYMGKSWTTGWTQTTVMLAFRLH
jgi:hypothetical protein